MIIILNAPPHCGKDTIADTLRDNHKFAKTEFKHTMFSAALALSGLSKEEYMSRYNNRDLKEKPWDKLGGLSCREFMIHISEEVMKPLFGQDVFGKRASSACDFAMTCGYNHIVFSDGGFIDEVKALSESGHKVLVARLRREGFDFGNDSRDYLYPDFCDSVDVHLIEGMPEVAVDYLLECINERI